MYRILFFGTSDFAVPSLNALSKDGRFEIVGVVTQPDRPVGRHAILTPPAIKMAAQKLGIKEIHQPEKLKDEAFQSWIKEVGPSCDAFVVVSYGKILPQWLLDLPKQGIINVHGSLLPRWRGPSPIQAAIAAGDTVSGVTIMKIDAEMDHGPLLATKETPIHPDDTGGSLHDRLADLGAEILPETLTGYLDGSIAPKEQDHSLATPCKILTRDDGKIDWNKSAEEIERLVRAYNPWPGTWMMVGDKRLKVLGVQKIPRAAGMRPGMHFINATFPCVASGNDTAVQLMLVQMEGKIPMNGSLFLHGVTNWIEPLV